MYEKDIPFSIQELLNENMLNGEHGDRAIQLRVPFDMHKALSYQNAHDNKVILTSIRCVQLIIFIKN